MLKVASLRQALLSSPSLRQAVLWGVSGQAFLADLARRTILNPTLSKFAGRSVVLAMREQFAAALALIELDGLAQRITLCPRDFDIKQLAYVFDKADADAVISDFQPPADFPGEWVRIVSAPQAITAMAPDQPGQYATEWVLLTSGTTSAPKLVLHNFHTLTAAITPTDESEDVIWGTFYDICRYGGLQVFLRVIVGGASLVLSEVNEGLAEYLQRLASHGATHILGTPTHWRRALMAGPATQISPKYVRLSGEIADQAVLDALRELYVRSMIAHAFATTEAGVAFAVNDGIEGFPADIVDTTEGVIQLKIKEGTIRIRSPGNAIRYLRGNDTQLKDEDGFVDTGDAVELRVGRYHFLGRLSGVINVGGNKVYPEEVEAVINTHPKVKLSLVRGRRSPIVGSIIVADVVLKDQLASNHEIATVKSEILDKCRATLSTHKIPASIDFVPDVAVGSTGKVLRRV